jgi:hypothetical protein
VTEEARFDKDVRLALYRFFVDRGRAPIPAELADQLRAEPVDVETALQRLADAHAIVLAPGSTYVWMANPLSAIPTPFPVETRGREWFGNCIWDALGIVAMLGDEGHVRTWCPDCGDAMSLEVRDGEVAGEGLIHFAVPAAQWWEDIGFT